MNFGKASSRQGAVKRSDSKESVTSRASIKSTSTVKSQRVHKLVNDI